MKTRLTFFLGLICISKLVAQNNVEFGADLMKLDSKWIFSQDAVSQPSTNVDSIPRPKIADIRFETGIDMQKPLFNSKLIDFKVPKFTADFDYTRNTYSTIPINSKTWISTARINANYIGMGGLSSAGAQYNWHINNFMFYSGGATFSKYNIYNNFDNNLSLNSSLRFELSDGFFFTVFGNYSTAGDKETNLFRSLNSSMFPQNNFGGSFEFKITDKWGLVTGVEREFDPFRGKWVTKPFVMPVFYGK